MKNQLYYHRSQLLFNTTGEGFPDKQSFVDYENDYHEATYEATLQHALSTSIPVENQSLIPNPVEGMTYEAGGEFEIFDFSCPQPCNDYKDFCQYHGCQAKGAAVARLLPEKPENSSHSYSEGSEYTPSPT